MDTLFEVLHPGALTTVQDQGRYGYQAFGMPVAGAIDLYAFRLANFVVGNDGDEAGLEITLVGPRLKVVGRVVVAVTGADLGARLNGLPLPLWQAVAVGPGDEIAFRSSRTGCRAYLAVTGGVAVPKVLGSRATYLRGKLGGLAGRPLQRGDRLAVGEFAKQIPSGRQVPRELQPHYGSNVTLRVIMGPQEDHFTPKGRETFLKGEYTVTPEADRMGYRLQGPKIEHRQGADIISDGIPPGAIQVPGHGQPIVMLSDRQTTGGYAKIATVASVDLPRLGQTKPGDRIRFTAITRAEAVALLREQEERVNRWLQTLPSPIGPVQNYRVGIKGRLFHIGVEIVDKREV